MTKTEMLSLPNKIIIDDDYDDFDKIFCLLKFGCTLSLCIVPDFDGHERYVLFIDKSGVENDCSN